MKHFYSSLFLTVLLSMVGAKASAYDAKIDDVYYDFSETEATVTYYSKDILNTAIYYGSVTIPDSVTYNGKTYSVSSIGDDTFYGCEGLTSITIPSSVTSIGNDAFYGCSGLTSITISSSVTSIGSAVFSGCSGLTSVTIPSSVTSIGSSVFSGCSSLTSVTIPSSVTSIGQYAFYRCIGLTSITIPSSVTSIGSAAFYGCIGLTSVTIPNSVTYIDKYAFEGCVGLTTITIPSSVTSIGRGAFEGCTGLTSVTIPSSVTRIGGYAFSDCIGLTFVTIPSSVTRIDDYAFSGCIGLTSITIPCSLTSIGDSSFEGCIGLTSITVDIDTPLPISENTFSGAYNATLYVPSGSGEAYEAAAYWTDFNDIVEINYKILTIGSSGYATFCSTKALDFSGVTDVKAYIATGFNPSTNTLVMTRVTKVPAGEGLFIVGKAGTYEIPLGVTNIMYSNLLKGVTSMTTITNPQHDDYAYFTLRDGDLGTFFYLMKFTTSLPAGAAYLQLPVSSLSANVKTINISLDGTVGVEEVKSERVKSEECAGAVYDVSGQQRSSMHRGVNIVRSRDGRTRKVVVK